MLYECWSLIHFFLIRLDQRPRSLNPVGESIYVFPFMFCPLSGIILDRIYKTSKVAFPIDELRVTILYFGLLANTSHSELLLMILRSPDITWLPDYIYIYEWGTCICVFTRFRDKLFNVEIVQTRLSTFIGSSTTEIEDTWNTETWIWYNKLIYLDIKYVYHTFTFLIYSYSVTNGLP